MDIRQAAKDFFNLSSKKQGLAVMWLALVFFVAASLFNYATQDQKFVKWLSPDETANYFFAKNFALHNSLELEEPLNLLADNIVHPRSFLVDNQTLKPMSFLGITLLYGQLAKIFCIGIIPYLTPFFGALGLIFFYGLVKELFDRRIALIATALASTLPPYFYFSSRSMFHNILFIAMALGGFYYGTLMNHRYKQTYLHRFVYPALSGLMFGWAAVTRTSELLWLAPAIFGLWLFNIRRTGIIKLLVWLSFLALSLLPVAYQNQLLYGLPWATG
ncbi:hypothetical protein HGA64_04915, partial [Candidatus Falkowbacteria bacterium]|nr:hypothetical protein [Candidatus Falkowbacteria bacterium]